MLRRFYVCVCARVLTVRKKFACLSPWRTLDSRLLREDSTSYISRDTLLRTIKVRKQQFLLLQNPFLSKRLGRATGNNAEMELAGTESGSSSSFQRNVTRGVKTQRFHERSNSAPDSYDWHSSR